MKPLAINKYPNEYFTNNLRIFRFRFRHHDIIVLLHRADRLKPNNANSYNFLVTQKRQLPIRILNLSCFTIRKITV